MTVDLKAGIQMTDHIDGMAEILASGAVERPHLVAEPRLGEFRSGPIGRG